MQCGMRLLGMAAMADCLWGGVLFGAVDVAVSAALVFHREAIAA